MSRLPHGGRIDRSRVLTFTFDGKRYQGHPGDTLASALLANDVHFVARSFKYHRPRGIVTAGVEEPNAIVQLEAGAHTVPNARATEIELYEGLNAASVNARPGLEGDRLAILGKLGRFIPSGFYYKTFMWPKRLWPKYETLIRDAAGLGVAPAVPDPDEYDGVYAHCDVLVVGAGPAGLAAALAAGRAGARVLLADEQREFGGTLLAGPDTVEGQDAAGWTGGVVAELRAMSDVTLLTRTTVYGYHDHNFLTACERLTDHLPIAQRRGPRERLWKIRAKRVVLATGAHERPVVFGNNDLPGVMLASAVSTYVHRYGVRPGRCVVVFTNNDSAYRTALDLREHGAEVTIVDARAASSGAWRSKARELGITIVNDAVVAEARGERHVRAVRVERQGGGPVGEFECDLLAVSGGWNPALHLHAQAGGAVRWDETKVCFVPGAARQAHESVGAANGDFDATTEALWLAGDGSHRGAKQFVDFQNDVTAADIALAAREGYTSVEHMKRYTTLGFGTDQGKLGNVNGLALLAQALGQSIAETGTTTFRPNYTPVTFGAVAGPELGERFDPVRTTAIHAWHEERGAHFEDVGLWKRPLCYPRAGKDVHAAVARECCAVRTGVGIMDASTLGKIDVRGPDALMLLNRVYTNAWDSLAVGRCRYGLMLDENGMVFDDGVTTRLGERHYLMSTTTGGAARVFNWLERWLQTEWPDLKVHLTSVTEQFATIAIAGPNARKVLERVCTDIDLSSGAFPFMSCREGAVAGVPARVMRISFSGELAFEVNVPATSGRAVWDALMAAGADCGITPYGTEAMHVLRAEKGYIIVGQDTDGSVTPIDLGMAALVKESDFLGRRSLSRAHTASEDRKQLVGLSSEEVLPEGGQIAGAEGLEGHVTSSYVSAALERPIALALVRRGRSRMGEGVRVSSHRGGDLTATICAPLFYDPEGTRLRA